MSDLELKPCPFCGGEAEMMGDLYPYVECSECHVNFSADHSYEFDFEDAAGKWNTRLQSEVERLRGRLCKTCEGHGMIGGPSPSAPDDGGESCPECRAFILREQAEAIIAATNKCQIKSATDDSKCYSAALIEYAEQMKWWADQLEGKQ